MSTKPGQVQAFNHLDKADTFPVDRVVGDTGPNDYDALVLPGGVANPDFLRMDQDAVDFVRGFVERSKPVAVICHGPAILVEADVVRGRTVTSWPSLRTDLRNAGATWVDQKVVNDKRLDQQPEAGRPASLLRDVRGGVRQAAAPRVAVANSRTP